MITVSVVGETVRPLPSTKGNLEGFIGSYCCNQILLRVGFILVLLYECRFCPAVLHIEATDGGLAVSYTMCDTGTHYHFTVTLSSSNDM